MSNLSEQNADAYRANSDVFNGGLSKEEIVQYYNKWAEAGAHGYDAGKVFELTKQDAEAYNATLNVYKTGISPEEVVEYYNKWAGNGGYDKHLNSTCYSGPENAARCLSEYYPDGDRPTVRILDVAAGTGRVGVELYKIGFRNIDALDPSEGMLKMAKEKGVYKNFLQAFIGVDKPVPIDNGTYDGLVVSGGFGEGHIPTTALHEMIRIVRPGGLIVNAMRQEYIYNAKEYKDTLLPLMVKLEIEGRWKLRAKITIKNYAFGLPGIVFAYEVL